MVYELICYAYIEMSAEF